MKILKVLYLFNSSYSKEPKEKHICMYYVRKI